MSESVYKIIEVIGSSPNSWEEAARNAVQTAGSSVRDLRVAEIVKLDMAISEQQAVTFRARVSLSFKYER
ncbi:MAG TPA: dodecin family protein [Rhodocyclaceae bacterium]